jgi:hypothetical protein
MNSIGLQETNPRSDGGHVNHGRDAEGSEASPSSETITTRVFVHETDWMEASRTFEHNAKSSASVADLIDQREFNQTIA